MSAAPQIDDDSPTLRMRTLVLDRRSLAPSSTPPQLRQQQQQQQQQQRQPPRSGLWPVGAPRAHDRMADPDASFATWQEPAMASADASMLVRAQGAPPPSVAPRGLSHPSRSPLPPPVVATISPDATLLPWSEKSPAARGGRGAVLLAVFFLLVAIVAGTFGLTSAGASVGSKPVAIAVRVARDAVSGVRELARDAPTLTSKKADAKPPTPPRAPRRARSVAAAAAAAGPSPSPAPSVFDPGPPPSPSASSQAGELYAD